MTHRFLLVFLLAALGAVSAFGQPSGFAANGTTNLSVTVGPEAAIKIDTATTNLTTAGTVFADFTGTTNFTYMIRTAPGGVGHIGLQITADFNGTGGPKVANPPTAGDQLTYNCTAASSGTPCTSGQIAATTASTPVVTFGGDAHSAKAGDTGSVLWTLTNDPVYKTGSYSATATLTISVP